MSTQNDDYRAFEYWPSEEERRIVAIRRSPEVDAMTDAELIGSGNGTRRRRPVSSPARQDTAAKSLSSSALRRTTR